MIEENPSFGYGTVAHLLDFNKNKVQRVFQLIGWHVRKRPVARLRTSAGRRTCVESALVSMGSHIWLWPLTATRGNCWTGT
jgi:hypothetical protein